MAFVIVKYAADGVWNYYYEDDPKLGVDRSHSAHFSSSGKSVGIKDEYASPEDAKEDFHKLMDCNPVGAYAICPVLY